MQPTVCSQSRMISDLCMAVHEPGANASDSGSPQLIAKHVMHTESAAKNRRPPITSPRYTTPASIALACDSGRYAYQDATAMKSPGLVPPGDAAFSARVAADCV